MRASILIPTIVALVLAWSGVAVVRHVTEPYIITPEKVIALLKAAPWKNGRKPAPAERKAFLESVVANVNKLTFDGQRHLRDEGRNETEDFVLDLTEAERKWFVAQTVERRFQAVMKSFKVMSLDERRKVINGAKNDMRKNDRGVESLDGLVKDDEKAFENIIAQGIGEYYEKGDDKRKLQLAPLLSEMQTRMRR